MTILSPRDSVSSDLSWWILGWWLFLAALPTSKQPGVLSCSHPLRCFWQPRPQLLPSPFWLHQVQRRMLPQMLSSLSFGCHTVCRILLVFSVLTVDGATPAGQMVWWDGSWLANVVDWCWNYRHRYSEQVPIWLIRPWQSRFRELAQGPPPSLGS